MVSSIAIQQKSICTKLIGKESQGNLFCQHAMMIMSFDLEEN